MPIPTGITADAVREAARLIDGGAGAAFGDPTHFLAEVDGRMYAPKALVGVAAGVALGKELKPADFSSGESAGQAVHFLRKLGFVVTRLPDTPRGAYLLTWNPSNWPWDEFAMDWERLARTGSVSRRWSTGNRTQMEPGDEVFLLKQGSDPRGLIGRGRALGRPFADPHWDHSRQALGDSANYITVQFIELLDWRSYRPLPVRELTSAAMKSINWSTPASGIAVPPDAAQELRALWGEYLQHESPESDITIGPDDVGRPGASEGTPGTRTVNTYERSNRNRRACIEHWGAHCFCCGLDMGERYGQIAEGYIHVHHINPLAMLRREHKPDPITDLRPVCPNCHAVIHLQSPPTSVEDLRRILTERRTQGNGGMK